MTFNLIQMANAMERLSDNELAGQIRNPRPGIPPFLALNEAKSREVTRSGAATAGLPKKTVKDEQLDRLIGGVSPTGIASNLGSRPQIPANQPQMPRIDPRRGVPQPVPGGLATDMTPRSRGPVRPQMLAQAPVPQRVPMAQAPMTRVPMAQAPLGIMQGMPPQNPPDNVQVARGYAGGGIIQEVRGFREGTPVALRPDDPIHLRRDIDPRRSRATLHHRQKIDGLGEADRYRGPDSGSPLTYTPVVLEPGATGDPDESEWLRRLSGLAHPSTRTYTTTMDPSLFTDYGSDFKRMIASPDTTALQIARIGTTAAEGAEQAALGEHVDTSMEFDPIYRDKIPELEVIPDVDYEAVTAAELEKLRAGGDPYAEVKAEHEKREAGFAEALRQNPWLALATGGFEAASGQSQYFLENLAKGGKAGVGALVEGTKDITEQKTALAEARAGQTARDVTLATEQRVEARGAGDRALAARELKVKRSIQEMERAYKASVLDYDNATAAQKMEILRRQGVIKQNLHQKEQELAHLAARRESAAAHETLLIREAGLTARHAPPQATAVVQIAEAIKKAKNDPEQVKLLYNLAMSGPNATRLKSAQKDFNTLITDIVGRRGVGASPEEKKEISAAFLQGGGSQADLDILMARVPTVRGQVKTYKRVK